MFSGFDAEMIPFFLDLRFHNSREFMDANRERYAAHVRAPFYAFIDALSPRLQELIPDLETRPNKCLSRINRDTRFSRDKSPYRDHLWVSWRRMGVGRDGEPFFWFEAGPDDVSWGMGVWGENRDLFDHLRVNIAAKPAEYLRLMDVLESADCAMGGQRWKKMTVPDGVPSRLGELYRSRSIYLEKLHIDPGWIYSPSICDRVFETYAALFPFYKAFRGCIPDEEKA